MYDIEFASAMEKINMQDLEYQLMLETVHPYDLINNKEEVLTEASEAAYRLGMTIEKINAMIVKMINKFMSMTKRLDIANKKLIEKYKALDIGKVDFTNLKDYEIYPYSIGVQRINAYNSPKWNAADSEFYLTNNGDEFKLKSFPKDVFIKDNSGNLIINADYFRGINIGGGKQKVSPSDAPRVFKNCLSVLESRKNIANHIVADSLKVKNEYKSKQSAKIDVNQKPGNDGNNNNTNQPAQQNNAPATQESTNNNPITESVLLDMSIFKDEYYDILYEDITTTDDIEKADKNGAPINSSTQENQQGANNLNLDKAAKIYKKVCCDVNTKMMTVLDEAYDECIKFCEKVCTLKQK